MTDAGPTPPRSTDHASLQRMAPARSSSSHWWRSHRRRRIHFAAASLPAGLRVPAGAARPAERPPKRPGLGARRQVDPGRAAGPQQFLQVQGRATPGPGPAQTAKRLHSGYGVCWPQPQRDRRRLGGTIAGIMSAARLGPSTNRVQPALSRVGQTMAY